MLVKLRNIVLESADVYALFIDEDRKKPEYTVYLHSKYFTLDKDEYEALVNFLKPKELL